MCIKKILLAIILTGAFISVKAQHTVIEIRAQQSHITELNKSGMRIGGVYSLRLKNIRLAAQAGLSYLFYSNLDIDESLEGKHIQFTTTDFSLGLHKSVLNNTPHHISLAAGGVFRFRNEVLMTDYFRELPWDETGSVYTSHYYDYELKENRDWGFYGNMKYEYILSDHFRIGVISSYNFFLQGSGSIDAGVSFSFTP